MQPGHSAENALELDDSENEQFAIVVELPRASVKADERASFNPVQDLHGFPSDDGVAHSPSSRALRCEASLPALRLVQSDTKSQDGKTEESGLKKIASRQSPSTSAAQRRTRKSYFGAEADKWRSSFRTSKVTRSGLSLNRCEWRKTEGDIFEPAEICYKTFASGEALACHVLTTHSHDVNESSGKVSCRWGSCKNRAYLPSDMKVHALKHLAHVAFCCPFTTCRLNAQSTPKTAKEQTQHIERAHGKASTDQLRPLALAPPKPLRSFVQLAQSVSKNAALLQQMPRTGLAQWQHDNVVLLDERSAQVKLAQGSRTPRRTHTQLVPARSLLAAPSESEASDEDEEEQDEVDSWSTTIAGLDTREPRAEPVRVPQLGARASMEDFVIYADQPNSGVSSDQYHPHRLVQGGSISELTLDAAAVMDPRRWLRNAGQSVSQGTSRYHGSTRPAREQEAREGSEDGSATPTSSSPIVPGGSPESLNGAQPPASSVASSSPPSSLLAPTQLIRAPRSVQLAHIANANKRKYEQCSSDNDDSEESDDQSIRSGVDSSSKHRERSESIAPRKKRRRILCLSDDET